MLSPFQGSNKKRPKHRALPYANQRLTSLWLASAVNPSGYLIKKLSGSKLKSVLNF